MDSNDIVASYEGWVDGSLDLLGPEHGGMRFERRDTVTEWEAEWVMWGVRGDSPLYTLAACRYAPNVTIESQLLLGADGRPRDAHLFWTGPKGSGVLTRSRETVVSLAAAARLVGEFGHAPACVRLESAAYEVDIEVYDRDARDPRARVIIAGEAKVGVAEHRGLVDGIRACDAPLEDDGTLHLEAARAAGLRYPRGWGKNHHAKCRYLRRWGPDLFWVVSPETPDEAPFRVIRDRGRVRLEAHEDGLAALRSTSGQGGRT